jgi:hypothetical protein
MSLEEEKGHRDRHRNRDTWRMPCDHEGKDLRCVHKPKNVRDCHKYQKLKEHGIDSSLWSSERE